MFARLHRYFTQDIWAERSSSLPRGRALVLNIQRVAALSVQLFLKNKCHLRASALTYFTLLSIVPVAALLFGIAKGYGFDALLAEKLRASLSGHEAVAERIIAFSSSTLENAKGGMIAGIGVLLLLWTVISLLSNIEGALNEIWGVHRGRPLLRKMSDYLSIVLICPVLIIVSGSATVYVASQVTGLSHSLPFGDVLNFLIAFALKALPFIATCGVFIFLYVFMPNTKVRWGSAIIAGLVAGCLYNLLQEVYVHTQIGVARNNAIYGSFAALPLFLVWLQLSWMIALFGAELSFAIQNVYVYELDPGDNGVSLARRRMYTLDLVRRIALEFEAGRPPMSDEQLSRLLEIPVRATRRLLFELVSVGILSETLRSDASKGYQPALPTERLTPGFVLDCVEQLGGPLPQGAGPVLNAIDGLRKSLEASPANKPLSKI